MVRTILTLAGALLMAAALSSPAVASTGEASLTRLENGLSVLVQPDERFPLVSLRLYVRAGSAYETDKQAGISHLLEHMVFKGTGKRAPGQVAEDIESAGGYLNAATSFDYTVYIIDLPADRWTLGLDVLRDMVFNVKLDPEELEREKKVVLAELERGEDSPGNLRFKTLQPMLWGGSTYERPIIGFRETVNAFTREDILEYIGAYYQPQSMLAVVVGNVDPEAARAEVEKYFGDLTNNNTVTPPPALPATAQDAPRVEVRTGPWNKAYLSVGFPVPGLHSAKAPGLDMLGHLLGGDETSLLYRKFKYELGLVDSISAYTMTLERTGLLYISAELDRDKLPEFWPALMKELAGVDASAFTDRELERARLNMEDSLYSSKETIGGLASKLGYFQFFENGLHAEENYLYAMNNVSRDELQALADEFITPAHLSSSVLVPEGGEDGLKDTLTAAVDAAFDGEAKAKAEAIEQNGGRGETDIVDLGGGRKLVLLPDETLPYTALTLAYAGGDALLFPDEQGLAALTSRSLTKGTASLSAIEYEDFLSDRAASIGASASRDMFVVRAKYPSRFAADVLPLFKETLAAPAFASEEVARAVKELQAAIRGREDRPTGLAFRHLFPSLFKDTGYSYLHMGTPETVAEYDHKLVADYWSRQQTKPWTLAVCGDFDRQTIVDLARELAASTKAEPFAFAKPGWATELKTNLTLADRNQSHIVVSFPVPGSRHEDSTGLDLMRQTLAGQGGILFRELRDKQGLGYTVTAFLWQAPETGFLAFYIGTYPDKTEQAIEGFKKAVADLRETPLDADEVGRAINLTAGDYYRDHQSLSSRSGEAAGLLARGFPLDHNRTNIEKAQTLTPETLQTLARKYLDWNTAYTLTVTP